MTPGYSKFYYCSSTDKDNTIRQAQANSKITKLLTAQGIESETVYTGDSGHANSAVAARIIGPILATRYSKSRRFIEI